jgi:hypothetical protein
MKSNYTLRYLNSTPGLSLALALKQCANRACDLILTVEEFVAIAPHVERPVVHWKIRTPVDIFARYGPGRKPQLEKNRYFVEGYIEPTCGFMILRSKDLARGKRISMWYYLQKSDPPAMALRVRDHQISDGAALDEAISRVRDESQEWLAKKAALPLQEPSPASPEPEGLESPLNLV